MDTELYECDVCHLTFKSATQLRTHYQFCKVGTHVTKAQKQKLAIEKYGLHYECDACHQKFISQRSLNSHYRFCKVGTHITRRQLLQLKSHKYFNKDIQKYICECGKEFDKRQSLLAHFSWCNVHKEAIGKPLKTFDNRIRKGDDCNFSKHYLGEEAWNKQHEKSRQTIELNIKNNLKQYKFNFNKHVKQGWYKGFYCDSSYELVYLIYCLEHNIKINRCSKVFKYEYNGKIHRYYPDFELEDGTIIEIKGYENEISKLKKKLFPQVKVLYRNDLI